MPRTPGRSKHGVPQAPEHPRLYETPRQDDGRSTVSVSCLHEAPVLGFPGCGMDLVNKRLQGEGRSSLGYPSADTSYDDVRGDWHGALIPSWPKKDSDRPG